MLDLSNLSQVDNSVLEAAVSEVESSDETRRLYLDCTATNVDASCFMQRYEGTQFGSDRVYVYKNLRWYNGVK